jgi:hypothetical protein
MLDAMRLAMFAIMAAAACGGGKGGGGPGGSDAISATEAEVLCRDACEGMAVCMPDSSVEACTSDCTSFAAGWMRTDALTVLATCTGDQPCGEDLDCEQRVQPLAIHAEYEASCRELLAACESDLDRKCEVDAPPAGTETFLRFVASEIMTDVVSCFDGSDCFVMSTCVSDTLGAAGFPLLF